VLAIPGSMLLWFILMPIYATVAPMVNISNEYIGVIERLFPDPKFWAMVVVLPFLCLIRDFAWKYAKRMYFPQSYHHVQEIQKYNIQDYRPRYVTPLLCIPHIEEPLTSMTEWSSSKKQSAKSGKYSACASSVDTPSPKQTSRKRGCYRRTILHKSVGGLVRWQVRESSANAKERRSWDALHFMCALALRVLRGSIVWTGL
jgi:phospholipid-transporting ATPase